MNWIVFFDIDGTLTRGVTSGAYLARLLGHERTMKEAEEAYARGELDNNEVCRIDAAGYAGRTTAELFGMLEGMPLVDGVAQAVEAIHTAGGEVLLQVLDFHEGLLLAHSALPPFSNSSFWRSQQ